MSTIIVRLEHQIRPDRISMLESNLQQVLEADFHLTIEAVEYTDERI